MWKGYPSCICNFLHKPGFQKIISICCCSKLIVQLFINSLPQLRFHILFTLLLVILTKKSKGLTFLKLTASEIVLTIYHRIIEVSFWRLGNQITGEWIIIKYNSVVHSFHEVVNVNFFINSLKIVLIGLYISSRIRIKRCDNTYKELH